jgi:hypothetical protein
MPDLLSPRTVAGGLSAHDEAALGNPILNGAEARTTNPTAVANGDAARSIASVIGVPIVMPYGLPDTFWSGTGSKADLTDLAIKASAGAGIRNYVTSVQLQNKSAVATDVVIKDGSTARVTIHCPANMALPACIEFPVPLRGTAATAVNIACLTTGANVLMNAQGFAAP